MERDSERRPILDGRLLNSCFWSANWICGQKRTRDHSPGAELADAQHAGFTHDSNQSLRFEESCGSERTWPRERRQKRIPVRLTTHCLEVTRRGPQVTGRTPESSRADVPPQCNRPVHPSSPLYHASPTSWSLINFCPSSINTPFQLHFRRGQDRFV